MKKKNLIIAATAAALIISLTGCGAKPSGPAPGGSSTSGSTSASPKVDLQAFYDDITGKYEFGDLNLADKEILDTLYPGMSDIDAEQM